MTQQRCHFLSSLKSYGFGDVGILPDTRDKVVLFVWGLNVNTACVSTLLVLMSNVTRLQNDSYISESAYKATVFIWWKQGQCIAKSTASDMTTTTADGHFKDLPWGRRMQITTRWPNITANNAAYLVVRCVYVKDSQWLLLLFLASIWANTLFDVSFLKCIAVQAPLLYPINCSTPVRKAQTICCWQQMSRVAFTSPHPGPAESNIICCRRLLFLFDDLLSCCATMCGLAASDVIISVNRNTFYSPSLCPFEHSAEWLLQTKWRFAWRTSHICRPWWQLVGVQENIYKCSRF